MSVLPAFDLQRPISLEAALAAITFDDVPFSGGTELLIAMRAGLLRPLSLVDLKAIPELNVISRSGHGVHLGGAVTYRAALKSHVIAESLPILQDVVRQIGNPRVRTAGTFGGNLCFAEPKSDVATILIALGATVTLTSTTASRVVSVDALIVGPYETVRTDDELLVSIDVPAVAGRSIAYRRFQTMERPTALAAVVVEPDGTLRVVVGALGGRPTAIEVANRAAFDVAAATAALDVVPDMTGSVRYKRHIARSVLKAALRDLEHTDAVD
jgi:aerobic carbon-monoxide dehydrogenase medium subunit